MNRKKLTYITEILAEQINHWALFPVIMTVTSMASTLDYGTVDSPNVLMWALCGLFPLVFFILREKVENFLLFFLLHLAVGAASLLFTGRNMIEHVLVVFFAACYIIYSFTKIFRESGNTTEPFSPIITVLISAIALSLQNSQGQSSWDAVYVATLVGVLALYAIYKYIRNYMAFLTANERSASIIPASDMFRSGIRLVSGYTLFGAGFLLLAGGGWVTSLRKGLRGVFLWIVRSFFHLFAFLISTEEQQPKEIMETPQTVDPGGFGNVLPKAEEPVLILRILEVAVALALVVLWLFLMYKGTLVLIELVRVRLAKNVELNAKEVYNDKGIDVREKCEIEKSLKRKGKKGSALFLSPYERVRRLYKRKVLSCALELIEDPGGRKTEMLSYLTARECADKLQLSALADIYEQTRYSDQETTKETVRQMKNVCRGIGSDLNAR